MAGAPGLADAVTGKPRWRFATGATVQSTPAVAHRTVYVGSSDYYLYALDAASGRVRQGSAGSAVSGLPAGALPW